MIQTEKDQKWRRLDDGRMELIEEIEIEREVEEVYSEELYLLDLDFRLSMLELGF